MTTNSQQSVFADAPFATTTTPLPTPPPQGGGSRPSKRRGSRPRLGRGSRPTSRRRCSPSSSAMGRPRVNAPSPQPPAVRTTCPYCGVGCGLLARPDGTGGAAIAGDPDHPANSGASAPRARRSARRSACRRRLLHPMLRQARRQPGAHRLAGRARPRRRRLPPHRRARRARRGRLLSLRPAPDRGLLRRQQADEGLHRLGQCRHQFAAVHGLLGRRPQARFRRRHRARHATRTSTLPTSSFWSARTRPGAIRCCSSAWSGTSATAAPRSW